MIVMGKVRGDIWGQWPANVQSLILKMNVSRGHIRPGYIRSIYDASYNVVQSNYIIQSYDFAVASTAYVSQSKVATISVNHSANECVFWSHIYTFGHPKFGPSSLSHSSVEILGKIYKYTYN